MHLNQQDTLENQPSSVDQTKARLLVIGKENYLSDDFKNKYDFIRLSKADEVYNWLNEISSNEESPIPDAIISELELEDGDAYDLYKMVRYIPKFNSVPFIVVAEEVDATEKSRAFRTGFDDFYTLPLNCDSLDARITFLRWFKKEREKIDSNHDEPGTREYNTFLFKRGIDIIVSFTALMLLSPLLLLIALIIKLESKGPVFYISKRAGTGYNIFNFYKFRSMRQNADEELKKLMHLNQYNGSFVKITNDPRVTRFGKFLRNSSLDEIPQLINVLKGDMSLVGNRPLPLYEAEKLTVDQWSRRFLAPAGITGLWQVTKRGKKGEMSEDERMQLDIDYANKCSFSTDMDIIMKTFPALLQEETV